MNQAELSRKAISIQESGDERLIRSFRKGRDAYSNTQPWGDAAEAYKIGLDLYFQQAGMSDFVSADQVTENVSVKQGFFDRLSVVPVAMQDEKTRELVPFSEATYARTLKQFEDFARGMSGRWLQEFYNYAQGSVLAINVWQGITRIELKYYHKIEDSQASFDQDKEREIAEKAKEVARELILKFEASLSDLILERDCLGDKVKRLRGGLSLEEIKRLEALKKLKEQ